MRRFSCFIGLIAVVLSGCWSPPRTTSAGAEPPTAYLLNHEEKDDQESISRLSFQLVDGRTLFLARELPGGGVGHRVEAGVRQLGVHFYRNKDVAFMQRGLPWLGRDVVQATLEPGRRYRVDASYQRGEMAYRYRLIDAETGVPVTEEREVNLHAKAPEWSALSVVPLVTR